jgi:xanthine dehydrogenase accessory factor
VQARGVNAVVVTLVRDDSGLNLTPGARLIVEENGTTMGSLAPVLDPHLAQSALAQLRTRRSELLSFRLRASGADQARVGEGDIDLFFEVLARPPRLVIVGAGHIAQPLAAIAHILDFDVSVLDDRPEYASPERFPDADQILVGPYRETLAGVPVDRDTHIVLVTRGHVHDQACLETVLDSDAGYIGMIGSKRRVRTVMMHLRDAGYDVERLEGVFAPVGLAIGAHTPAEIALAIMAEIVTVRRGASAQSLALRKRLRI